MNPAFRALWRKWGVTQILPHGRGNDDLPSMQPPSNTRFARLFAFFIALPGVAENGTGAEATGPIESARELWAGYDPRAEPLEIAVAKSWWSRSIDLGGAADAALFSRLALIEFQRLGHQRFQLLDARAVGRVGGSEFRR